MDLINDLIKSSHKLQESFRKSPSLPSLENASFQKIEEIAVGLVREKNDTRLDQNKALGPVRKQPQSDEVERQLAVLNEENEKASEALDQAIDQLRKLALTRYVQNDTRAKQYKEALQKKFNSIDPKCDEIGCRFEDMTYEQLMELQSFLLEKAYSIRGEEVWLTTKYLEDFEQIKKLLQERIKAFSSKQKKAAENSIFRAGRGIYLGFSDSSKRCLLCPLVDLKDQIPIGDEHQTKLDSASQLEQSEEDDETVAQFMSPSNVDSWAELKIDLASIKNAIKNNWTLLNFSKQIGNLKTLSDKLQSFQIPNSVFFDEVESFANELDEVNNIIQNNGEREITLKQGSSEDAKKTGRKELDTLREAATQAVEIAKMPIGQWVRNNHFKSDDPTLLYVEALKTKFPKNATNYNDDAIKFKDMKLEELNFLWAWLFQEAQRLDENGVPNVWRIKAFIRDADAIKVQLLKDNKSIRSRKSLKLARERKNLVELFKKAAEKCHSCPSDLLEKI